MMIPGAAQASATAIACLAPSSSASMMPCQVMSARVVLRSNAAGTQASVPASAQSGAL